jgi:MoxR-like ATPase
MNFQDTLQAIEISVLGGRTPYLVGHAGIGKSNIGKEFCEKYENVRLVTLFGSLIKEGELNLL